MPGWKFTVSDARFFIIKPNSGARKIQKEGKTKNEVGEQNF